MTLSIDIPEELYEQALTIAEAHNVSVEQIFVSAFADQLAAWRRLCERADCGDREKFLAVLDKVADIEPEEHDRL